MTFDFDSINTGGDREPVTLFDHIRDQMRPDAPEAWVHLAYAEEAKKRMANYKHVNWLIRFWFGQTSALRAIGEENPVILLDIIHHFEAELDRLTDIPARDGPAAA